MYENYDDSQDTATQSFGFFGVARPATSFIIQNRRRWWNWGQAEQDDSAAQSWWLSNKIKKGLDKISKWSHKAEDRFNKRMARRGPRRYRGLFKVYNKVNRSWARAHPKSHWWWKNRPSPIIWSPRNVRSGYNIGRKFKWWDNATQDDSATQSWWRSAWKRARSVYGRYRRTRRRVARAVARRAPRRYRRSVYRWLRRRF